MRQMPMGPMGPIPPMTPPANLPPTPTITPAAMIPGAPGANSPVVHAAGAQPAATAQPIGRSFHMELPRIPILPPATGSSSQPADRRNTEATEGRLKWDVFGR